MLLDIYKRSESMLTQSHTWLFVVALILIVKNWKQPNVYQQMNKWPNCGISILWNVIQKLKESKYFLFFLSWYIFDISLSMEFFRQEYWSRLPFPPPGDLSYPGIEPASPVTSALQWILCWATREDPNWYVTICKFEMYQCWE